MPYTREQLQGRGRETAEKLLGALEAQKTIAHFVDDYVSATGRRGLRASPLRYRELMLTLHREALLAVAVHVHAALPARITRRKTGLLRGDDADNAATFQEEFFAALGEGLNWGASEAEEFLGDFELCRQMAARVPAGGRPRRAGDSPAVPFVERCALLLDPSFLDKAQRAATSLLEQLEALAGKILAAVFRPRRKD